MDLSACVVQVKLHFTDKALQLIAQKAMVKNTGARGLRAILENILTDAMFEVWKILFLGTLKTLKECSTFLIFY